MNYITANGQKVGKPETTNQLLDMVGHAWAYQHMERKKSALTAKSYLELYDSLRNNEHQLRKYFERGGEAFGDHITILIDNLTTSFLSSAYNGCPFNPYIHLAFQSESIQKITLNTTYPDIWKKNGRNNDYQGGCNNDRYNGNSDRYKNRGHKGGYHSNQNDNRSDNNNRNSLSGRKEEAERAP